ncbi:LSM domain-containing protein [Staphylococcus pseudintermedius]|uniref:LSM domain-containing protein n=1 Tax=Staphylococcus pseudintermedius TaxID=283734 RepID=UPI001A00BAFD|nr:LSM domain-containing protein [Staphylococcus pseudintermedius]EGQ2871357.1 LSM domain protein [Staphylococcus pseudintermedius]EGQ3226561.1 LSM domain protein [Staphylococcus pseudintermedius]EGQ3232944.1 LSM domain protein [Staphylococcus pseudintermedius]EGQ3404261.1 LSM domain protein [Staphylococcus pseudintermedius]EGQ3417399.1 LSM domain protein [Staphylococcus pseudintermedius]
MKLWTYVDKNVRVILKNGKEFNGCVSGYDDEVANDNGEDCIYLDVGMELLYEFRESEIKSIEVLD